MLIALCAGRATSAMVPHQHALCAVRSIQTCAWPSMQIRYRTVTRRSPVSSTRIVKLAQRVPAFLAWLRCCSYANKFVNPLPLCGFVNWYPIMRREAGALNVYPSQLERKNIKARQSNYKKPKLFCIN